MNDIEIRGPITGGSHGWPFAAAVRDLAAEGYIEEEYFFSGNAHRYRPVGALGIDGHWTVERAGTDAFTTRALIRRPADPARFNGTVIVEWNNVSAGMEIFEGGDTSVIFDEGFAYVGVSAQVVGVNGHDVDSTGLKAWDRERYGSLHIPDDGLSYGIFSEVARAVSPNRSNGGVDPLGGLDVQRVLGIGGSQSAGRLCTYINAVQPIENIFDGFLLFTWFGSGYSIDSTMTMNIANREAAAAMSTATRIREDLAQPVMVVNTECETLAMAPVRQSDTDTFRVWEVAGAPHGPRLHMERIFTKMMRDQVTMAAPPDAPPLDPSTFGPVPFAPVMDAAIGHLHRWMAEGIVPPAQPLIELDGNPPHVKRDNDGNALGGVRLPEMETTLTRNIGCIVESGPASLMGITTPLPTEVIAERYPTAAAYLSAFRAAADASVAAGVLRRRDADEAIERATATAATLS